MKDTDLINGIIKDEPKAIEFFLKNFKHMALNLCNKNYVINDDDVNYVLVEVLIKFKEWLKVESNKVNCKVSTILYSFFHFHSLKYKESVLRNNRLILTDDIKGLSHSYEENFFNESWKEVLYQKAKKNLTKKELEYLELHFSGVSNKEIAEMDNNPWNSTDSLKSLKNKIKHKMRKEIKSMISYNEEKRLFG